MSTLESYREQIDSVDRELLRLLEQRMTISEKIAEVKREQGLPTFDRARENSKLGQVKKDAAAPFGEYAADLFSTLFDLSKRYQRFLRGETDPDPIPGGRNLVLIGMPGSGKTTIGKELGTLTGRAVIDTDELIKAAIGCNPGDYLREHGEEAFRKIESDLLTRFRKTTGLILSTGGGAVLRSENVECLREHGILVWIRRPLEDLDIQGRPLSQQKPIEELYAEREPLYRDAADLILDNTSSPEEAADLLLLLVKAM